MLSMLRGLLFTLAVVLVTPAVAFTPLTGHWWNPAESGTGYNIDIQDGTLVVLIFSFKQTGEAQWYISAGPMGAGQRTFTGQLLKAKGGQCISCPYAGSPGADGTDGNITITFTSETTATVALPGGRTTNIQPFNFGWGTPPNGLLGEWVYVYDIVTSWVDRYDYTVLDFANAPAGTNGMVVDVARLAGCALYVSGPTAGTVVCADVNAAGTLENGHAYTYGLSETFNGVWISPSTGNQYAMKGFRVVSKSGYAKAAIGDASDPHAAGKAGEDAARFEKLGAAHLKAIHEVAAQVRRVLGLQK